MMPFHLRGFAGSKPAAHTKQILLMLETRPSKEFQVNHQGRKNNCKDNASELASSHPKRRALSLSALTLEYNLIFTFASHALQLFLLRLFSNFLCRSGAVHSLAALIRPVNVRLQEFPSTISRARRAAPNPSPQELLVTC